MERIASGVHGLDEVLEGGLPKNSTTLVKSGAGGGKTIFCMQFVCEGAREGKPGVFVSFNEPLEGLRERAKDFGWNLRDLEEKGLLVLVDGHSPRTGAPSEEEVVLGDAEPSAALHEILGHAKRVGAERVAIDSAAGFYSSSADETQSGRALMRLAHAFSRGGLTAVVSSESTARVDEHAVDGVIELTRAEGQRFIEVKKMRGARHSMHAHPFEITEKGLVVKKAQTL